MYICAFGMRAIEHVALVAITGTTILIANLLLKSL